MKQEMDEYFELLTMVCIDLYFKSLIVEGKRAGDEGVR